MCCRRASTSPEPDVWQHVLVTFTADGPAKMYIDGELEGESSIGQNRIPGNTHTFQIGARRSSSGNPSNFWDGLIDDVGIWNCELAESDIALLSGKGNGGYAGRRSPTNLGAPEFALREGLFMYFSLDNASVDGDLIQDGANHAGAPLNGNKTNGRGVIAERSDWLARIEADRVHFERRRAILDHRHEFQGRLDKMERGLPHLRRTLRNGT